MKFVFLLISLLFSGQVFSKNIECYGAMEGSLPSGLYKNQAPHLHIAIEDKDVSLYDQNNLILKRTAKRLIPGYLSAINGWETRYAFDAESDVSFMTVLNDKIVTFYFELNNNQYELEFRDCIALDEL